MTSEPLIWGFGLFALAILLFLVEVFLPTGGIVGIASAAVAIAGIVAFFFEDPWWGSAATLAFLVLVPVCFNFALKVFPRTPFGKQLILGSTTDDEEEQAAADAAQRAREERERAEALVGATGTAKTDLHPIGSATFDGSVIEVSSETGFIEKGTPIRITRVEGNRVKVRPKA
jgi:membrane-bound serine protease (ClpP class)